MSVITQISRRYSKQKRNQTAMHKALDSLNYFLAATSGLMAFLFWGPPEFFPRPTTPPNEVWLSLSYMGFEIWDVMFPISAVFLFLSTAFYTKLGTAHALAAFTWGSLGLLYSIHGIFFPPTEFFAFGIMALFCSVIHVNAIRIWSAERIG